MEKELEQKYQTNYLLGLTEEEAKHRLKENGQNKLLDTKKVPLILRFLSEFNNALIYILLVSGIVSLCLKEYADAIIILFVVLMNGIMGFIQEEKANKSLEALKKISSNTATVKRDGKYIVIPAEELVIGDIIKLEEGNAVPADAILIKARELLCDESALTGESQAVLKDHTFKSNENTPTLEKQNYVFMSTLVMQGHAEAVVAKTGMNTEIGHIATLLDKHKDIETPLQKKLANLGRMLGFVTIAICVTLFVIALIQKRDIVEMFVTSISLAVAAVPEGLPAVVTIVLAIGVQRLIKSNMIIRKLHAVETLGAVNKILTDKTGTLTENQMTIVEVGYNSSIKNLRNIKAEKEFVKLCTAMLNCNNANIDKTKTGDPTEIAILSFAKHFKNENRSIKIDELAFTSERKMMSVLIKENNKYVQYSKGAIETLLDKCDLILFNGKEIRLNNNEKNKQLLLAKSMAKKALRVIAFAYKNTDKIQENKMVFIGMVGMIDPPKRGVKEAINNLNNAGIETIMITGDNIDTAFAIAKELNIAETYEECLEGKQLDNLSNEELNTLTNQKKVFARVSPSHKIKIVEAFQNQGNLVAMTGDGVNDAPSLRKADVGIAMGKNGTDVAKNAADMILIDDNYASISKAVKEGRNIYANIRKTTLFLLSSNIAEVLAMIIGILFSLPTPLVAVHILWVNLITDSLPAIALGVDKASNNVMNEKPRHKNSSLFAEGGYKVLGVYGFLITILTLISFFFVPVAKIIYEKGISANFVRDVLNLINNNEEVLLKCRTYAFTTLGISQLFHMIGMSDINLHIKDIIKKKNGVLLFALCIGICMQILVTEIPVLTNLFHTASLSFQEWIFLIMISAYPLVVHELMVKKSK